MVDLMKVTMSLYFFNRFWKRSFIIVIVLITIIIVPNLLNATNLFYYPSGHFSFNLLPGWKRVSSDVVAKYTDELMYRMKGTIKRPNIELLFSRIEYEMPFEGPYFIITIYKGYITQDTINKYIESMQQTTKKSLKKESFNKIYIDSLISQPIYDPYKNILTYSMDSKMKAFDGGDIYQTAIISLMFFKYGVVHLNFFCPTNMIQYHLSTIKTILESFTFDEGYKFK